LNFLAFSHLFKSIVVFPILHTFNETNYKCVIATKALNISTFIAAGRTKLAEAEATQINPGTWSVSMRENEGE
jgi:hypothetical protein